VSSTLKEHQDSDVDLDVDGDDTLEYGKAQYPYLCCKIGTTRKCIDYFYFILFFFVKAFLIIKNVSSANDRRYTEADVIPCSGNEPRDAEERHALRGAVLKYAQTQTAHFISASNYFINT